MPTLSHSLETTTLAKLCNIILDEESSHTTLTDALDTFSLHCSRVTNISPNPSFNAWAEDAFLEQGLAINPSAAAYCIKDYQRSVAFIRGIHEAICFQLNSSSNETIELLYAGCGPFATLLLTLIGKYQTENVNLERLKINLLDIHQPSLDSVNVLLNYFEINTNNIILIRANACTYQHSSTLDLIIAETMQKSLEQEPQFAVTANLAPQLSQTGIFIPESILVSLCLANWNNEVEMHDNNIKIDHTQLVNAGKRHPLGTLLDLKPHLAATLQQSAILNKASQTLELKPVSITLPDIDTLESFDVLLLTRIRVFNHHQLFDYESDITLPSKCHTISPKTANAQYLASYQLGNYPKFSIRYIQNH